MSGAEAAAPPYTFHYSTTLPVSSTKRHAYIIEVSGELTARKSRGVQGGKS